MSEETKKTDRRWITPLGIIAALLLLAGYFWFIDFPVSAPLSDEEAAEVFSIAYDDESRSFSVLSRAQAGYTTIWFLAAEPADPENVYVLTMQHAPFGLPRYTLDTYFSQPADNALAVRDYTGVYDVENPLDPVVTATEREGGLGWGQLILRYLIALGILSGAVLLLRREFG